MYQKRVYLAAYLLLIVCLSGIVYAPSATGYAPGVKAGDMATYSYTRSVPTGITGFQILITEVNGDLVKFNYTHYLYDGTSTTWQYQQNFSFPSHILPYKEFMIPANVGNGVPIGDVVTNGSILALTVASGRRTCVRSYTSGLVSILGYGTYFSYTDYYWDQATGITVRNGLGYHLWLDGQWTIVETSWQMTSTNMWTGADLSSLLVIGAVAAIVVVVLAAAAVYRRVKYQGIGVAEPTFGPKRK